MAAFQHIRYQYEPLPTSTSIRLLSRRAHAPGDSSPSLFGVPLLQLSLDTVDLADDPTYGALSYTWGSPFPGDSDAAKEYNDPNSKWPILVNDRLFLVGQNLYNFLDRYFPSDEMKDQRHLPYNKTDLIIAAEAGKFDDVEALLDSDSEIEAQDMFGETALHYAAENGHFEIVEALVKAGSDIHKVDSHGRTPLLCATRQEKPVFYKARSSINS